MFRYIGFVKILKLISLLVLVSLHTQAFASLDTCYTVFEHGFEEAGLAYGTVILFGAEEIQIGEDQYSIESQREDAFGHRRQVIEYFDCQYRFDFLSTIALFKVFHFQLEGGLEYWVIQDSEQVYLFYEGQVIVLSPCIPDGYCFNRKHCKAKLVKSSLELIPVQEEVQFTESSFETVTEQVLVQESYSILEVVPAQFETITEQFLVNETVVCPDYTPEYETVFEQVLVSEAYPELEVIPAVLTTLVEQVLVKDAHQSIELIWVDSTDSLYIETTPSYTDYSWSMREGNCIEDIYGCCDFETLSYEAVVTGVANPSTWNCGTMVDWNNQIVIKKQIPAQYAKRCFMRLTQPASSQTTTVLATYTTLTKELLINSDQIPDSCKVQQYETRSYQRLVAPPTTMLQEVPAHYQTRSYEKLVEVATITSGALIQNCSQTMEYDYLANESMALEEEILCNYTFDEDLQQDIIEALVDKNFLDDLTTEFGSKEFWEGVLEAYQFKGDTECISNLDEEFFDYIFDQ